MKFDIKDVKSWANRHDVKAGDVGYVTCDFNTFLLTTKVALVTKATVKDIDDNDSRCFLAQPLDGKVVFHYGFFLPVDAVKEDKPKKKYRPFKNLNEIQSVLCGGDVTKYAFFDVGTHLTVRHKDERNREQVILITSIEYIDGYLYLINDRGLDEWFNNFELLVNDTWVHFGIEVKDDE